MKLRIIFSLSAVLVLLFAPFALNAQDVKKEVVVSGKVVDEGGLPFPGVSILIKGTTRGVASDVDGTFQIKAPEGSSLIFIMMGYKDTEIIVGKQSTDLVKLVPDAVVLNSTVVTALGIRRDEKALGYSATKVDGDAFTTAGASSNWVGGLTGQVAGLSIDRSSGSPNGSMRVTLRGESTVNFQDNSALFVIDGVPMYNTSTAAGVEGDTYAVDFGDGTADLDPDNIESVTVLKGAAATALYGSNAANGAIIITTKSADKQKEKIQVDFKTSFTFDKLLSSPDLQYEYGQGGTKDYYYYTRTDYGQSVMNPEPVAGLESQAGITSWGPKMDGTPYYQFYDEVRGIGGHYNEYGDFVRDATPFVSRGDWFKNYFVTGATVDNNLTVSGKIDKRNSIRLTFADKRGHGMSVNTPFNAQTISVKARNSIAKWLKAETNLTYKRNDNGNIPVTSGYGSTALMYSLWCYAPNVDMSWPSVYWQHGKEGIQQESTLSGGKNNIYFLSEECVNSQQRHRVYGNVKLDADLFKGMTLMVRGGLDMAMDHRCQQQGTSTQAHKEGWYRELNIGSRQFTGEFLFTYKHNFKHDIDLSANFGGSILHKEYEKHTQTADNLKIPSTYTLANSIEKLTIANFSNARQTNSLYGMVSMSWRNALFLDVTGRNDWSSTLPAGNRSYFYPSVSFSVALNDLFDFGRRNGLINLMKLRTSWAQVGHDTEPYRYEDYLAVTNFPGNYSIQQSQANSQLKPEIVTSWEVGLDLKMFKNRFSLDFAYYDGKTKNLIANMPVSYATGASGVYTNAGSIRNYGFELQTQVSPIRSSDFEWKIGFNWSANRNYVLSLGEGVDSWIVGSYSTHAYMTAYTGGSVTAMYGKGYVRAPKGSYAIDSAGQMVDVSGMMVLNKQGQPQTASDLQYLGDCAPDWRAGLNTTFRWKDLSVYIGFDGQKGGHVFSYTNWVLNYRGKGVATLDGREGGLVPEGVILQSDGNYVINTTAVPADAISAYYACKYDQANGEANFVGTDFIKLRDIKITYKFPAKLLQKTKVIKGLSISAYGNNLYCWSKFPGFDPEALSMRGAAITPGFELLQYPTGAKFGGSIALTF